MKVKDLINEVNESQDSIKDKLMLKMGDLHDIIEKYEETGEISKEDQERMATFKEYIRSLIKDHNEKKIINGDK
jgi:hypothetical protein